MDLEKLLMPDRGFGVWLDQDGSSPRPLQAIWRHQHVCVTENDFDTDTVPAKAWNAIERELGFGHWDVLGGASLGVSFTGFPHATAMQWRTHKDTDMLCQSMRFTGKRFQAPLFNIDLDKVFYRFPQAQLSDGQYSYRK
jgi:hypothetical protein